jgi:DNA-binding response OmpR family regulator
MAKKILIVDDSGTSLLMAKMVLSQEPFELVTAKDGVEALAVAASQPPDLVLLDIVMPRMDGFEACRQLRTRSETRDTPILMVTTRGEEANVERGYESGCTDYICKPINPSELLAKVRTYLGE